MLRIFRPSITGCLGSKKLFPICHNISSASCGFEHDRRHLTESADPHYKGSSRPRTLVPHLKHIKIQKPSSSLFFCLKRPLLTLYVFSNWQGKGLRGEWDVLRHLSRLPSPAKVKMWIYCCLGQLPRGYSTVCCKKEYDSSIFVLQSSEYNNYF